MNTLLATLAALLLLACAWLGWQLGSVQRNLRRTTSRIEEIRGGNRNQRVRLPATLPALTELGGSLNRLIDDFQRNAEKMNLLESERKKMISHLSHDLRTPLTAILGYVEMLLQDTNLGEDERRRYLQVIYAKGDRLSALIQDFFELSKLEADDAPLKLSKVNIVDVIQETAFSFYRQFQEAKLSIDLQMPESPVFVRGHGPSLERIMANLLSNSLRYGSGGGVIGIQVSEEGDCIRIEVWDRGQGISETDLPHIFERLYTGKTSRNAVQQGNGLGLTIVKKLIEKQNGDIQATSVPFEKTNFCVYLPKAT